jgi:hypothetical protein
MKSADLLPRFLSFVQRNELLEAVADKLVWLITCYSVALGLLLAAALLCARQGVVLVRTNARRLR